MAKGGEKKESSGEKWKRELAISYLLAGFRIRGVEGREKAEAHQPMEVWVKRGGRGFHFLLQAKRVGSSIFPSNT